MQTTPKGNNEKTKKRKKEKRKTNIDNKFQAAVWVWLHLGYQNTRKKRKGPIKAVFVWN